MGADADDYVCGTLTATNPYDPPKEHMACRAEHDDADRSERWVASLRSGRTAGPLTTEQLFATAEGAELGPDSWVRLLPGEWTTVGAARPTYAWRASLCGAEFHWSYLDQSGHEVGPVPGHLMLHWDAQGWFPGTTPVRRWPHGWFPMWRLPRPSIPSTPPSPGEMPPHEEGGEADAEESVAAGSSGKEQGGSEWCMLEEGA